jgi:hypothetical protein
MPAITLPSRCVILICVLTGSLWASREATSAVVQDVPEPQVSFARELHPHTYYVRQAELWSAELQKDSTSESNWYNYFRACRNAHGTADWRSDFVNESPALKEGDEIVRLMERFIPGTFTYHYLSYLSQGIGTDRNEHLMKAYAMNPTFEGIHSSVVSYAESSLNTELRRTVNRAWFDTNYLSHQLLTYNYNVLMSLDSNAILLTQADNDTYPAWMLQDALGIRTDVTVINIDFLLFDAYRDSVLRSLRVDALDLGAIDINDYHTNWQRSVEHILRRYGGDRPIYLGMTLFEHLYEDFKDNLHISGLAFRYCTSDIDLAEHNRRLVHEAFHLNYIEYPFTADRTQGHINHQNTNYLHCLKLVYDLDRSSNDMRFIDRIRRLAEIIAARIPDSHFYSQVKKAFK